MAKIESVRTNRTETPAYPGPVPSRTPDDHKGRRLPVPITPDGRLDPDGISGMRASTREALRRALTADPEATARLLGAPIASRAAGGSPEFMSLERAERVCGMFGSLFEQAFRARYPADIAHEALAWSDADRKALAPSLAAVTNKHAGAFLGKWGDECELIGMAISLVVAKISLANASLAQRQAERTRPQPIPFPPTEVIPEPAEATIYRDPENPA